MATYIVLIPDNEKEWAAADESERQRVYGKHREFSDALAERGHKMTGGAELADVDRRQGRTPQRLRRPGHHRRPLRRGRRAAQRLLPHRDR